MKPQVLLVIVSLALLVPLVVTARFLSKVPALSTWITHLDFDNSESPFPEAIDYPHAGEIREGMTQADVQRLIGSPTNVEHSRFDLSFDTQWHYHFFGWSTEIYIWFNKGQVTEATYGHG